VSWRSCGSGCSWLVIIYGLPRLTKRGLPSNLVAIVVHRRDSPHGVAQLPFPGWGDLANFLRTCQSFAIPTISAAFFLQLAIILPTALAHLVCWAAAVVSHSQIVVEGLVDESSDYEAESQAQGIATSLPACLAAWQVRGMIGPECDQHRIPAVATASPPSQAGVSLLIL